MEGERGGAKQIKSCLKMRLVLPRSAASESGIVNLFTGYLLYEFSSFVPIDIFSCPLLAILVSYMPENLYKSSEEANVFDSGSNLHDCNLKP